MTCKCGHDRLDHEELRKAPWVGICRICGCTAYQYAGRKPSNRYRTIYDYNHKEAKS